MTNAIPCTVQILCRNGAPQIERCLESCRDFSEVILQDGYSADGTREIAARFPNVRIMDQNRELLDPSGRIRDFAAMRNESIAAARHDWILVIDADEAIPAAMVDEVRETIGRGKPGVFIAARKFVVDGILIERFSCYPAEQIRFFHRSCVTGYAKAIHERLILKPGVLAQRLNTPLPIALPPLSELLPKYDRYLDMEVRRLGVVSYPRWLRWMLLRNLRTAAGIGVRATMIRMGQGGPAMPLSYERAYMRYALKTIVRTFPANARRFLRDA